ncbi:FHA domain-containing protein [Bifidobacterium panos]|uniref:FHA domain-containing protein n=1 Tax=Bifidobacterium panos TaxID=2675321 RepID=A0ABX1SUT9_9BIFI|nr:FHA domain-containing protein [Bifidobacterium sp. DSM 109963]NMN01591.1 hypothetical protein [Bifidobacterium sp. DSM 109963]
MSVTYRWRVQVGSGQQATVRPGESLEIGRKPLRPLPDDGMTRLEVADSTKSMSKRHARFSVDKNGQATLRDLQSTNGSYMVSPDGELTRLPLGEDFVLPAAAVRMQFGDVPVDFAPLVEEERPAGEFQVPDLFLHSAAQTRQEPDAADMSVDEILDLRAGEPTTIFHASSDAPVAQAAGEHPEASADSMPIHVSQPQQTDTPRDLFADAMVDQQQTVQGREAPDMESSVSEPSEPSEPSPQPVADNPVADNPTAEKPVADNPAVDNQEPQPTAAQPADTSQQAAPAAETTAYTPAFEAGSVFDRVSRGEFDKPNEPAVEVDGMTSDEARTTTDMSLQFEMARHAELLPFLAMNPSLYDDLYAWLDAQGNRDIDEALANNAGYQSYREAVGK